MKQQKRVLGVGSPIVDVLAQVPDSFLAEAGGAKGGMELVDTPTMERLVALLEGEMKVAPGGSAANTIFALARLGMPAAFLGKIGEDEMGAFYTREFERLGGDLSRFKRASAGRTAQCLSLVTPDSERTMRTDLGAAALLSPEEIVTDDFRGYDHVHVEGYLLFNRALAQAVLRAAKEAGCLVSLDLGSFEVVGAAREVLEHLLRDYVDIVFANEDEAEAFIGVDDPEQALHRLANLCDVAAVKLGAEGALLQWQDSRHRARALKVDDVVDTTGAGDLWAAGFLYAHLNGLGIEHAAHLAAMLGAEVVQRMGADLDDAGWQRVVAHTRTLVSA